MKSFSLKKQAFPLALYLFLSLAMQACNASVQNSPGDFADFAGVWRQISQENRVGSELDLRIFFYNSDSSLSMLQYEQGPRSRVWKNKGTISFQDGKLWYDKFSAFLNNDKDTLHIHFRDATGTIYPVVHVRSTTSQEQRIMARFVEAMEQEQTYMAPSAMSDGWEVAHAATINFDSRIFSELISEVSSGKYGDVHNILIAKDGKLIFEQYFAANGKLTGPSISEIYQKKPHHLASITKPITSILLGIAIDRQNVRSVDDPIYRYFADYPQLKTNGKDKILIKHLLTMSSGLSWIQFGYSFQDERNDAGNLYRCDDVLGYYFSKNLFSEPGNRLNYSNASATAVGALIEKATNSSIAEFAANVLFDKLAIEQAQWSKYPDGTFDTDGSLALRPRDLAKIGQVVLNKGSWQGHQLVSAEWIQLSTQDYFQRTFTIGYGYYWQQMNLSAKGRQYHTILGWGDGGQFLFIFPEIQLVVASNAGNYGKGQDKVIFDILKKHILPAL